MSVAGVICARLPDPVFHSPNAIVLVDPSVMLCRPKQVPVT